ncbi:MAG: DUF433 domain-containing protein [Acidobacteriota bacterium]
MNQLVYNDRTMSTLETTISAPLTQWEDGTIRITGSRVPIDTVIHHFRLGATAEEIGYKFSSLRLADIYGAIYYYLAHRKDVEEYLRQQEAAADAVQQRIESDPEYQQGKAEMRARLLARWAERNPPVNPSAGD